MKEPIVYDITPHIDKYTEYKFMKYAKKIIDLIEKTGISIDEEIGDDIIVYKEDKDGNIYEYTVETTKRILSLKEAEEVRKRG